MRIWVFNALYVTSLQNTNADGFCSWVAEKGCTAEFCSKTYTFDASSSSTFESKRKQFNISYGSGDAGGYLANDIVSAGGFTIRDQAFGVSRP